MSASHPSRTFTAYAGRQQKGRPQRAPFGISLDRDQSSACSASTVRPLALTSAKPPWIWIVSGAAPSVLNTSIGPSRIVDMTGAWRSSTPKSPSVPGTTTMWTSSERTSLVGVTSSKWIGIGSGLFGQLLGLLDRFLDAADHVERLLGQVVVLAVDDRLERAHGVLDLHELAGDVGEHLGDVERLAEEALDLARPADGQLIFFAELVHAENGDDVLQALVALQSLLNGAGGLVMLLADDRRGEHAAGRIEGVDRRIDAEFGDRAAERRRRVEVGERGGRRRVGQVVGRYVDRLDRGDRALVGRGDPLLKRAHVGGERRLITDRRGDAAEQRRHFRARLGEAEDVVDEEQNVLAFDVAEIFGLGEARQSDAGARARRLVHLAEHQSDLRALGRRVAVLVLGDDARLEELVVEVVAFAGALADP